MAANHPLINPTTPMSPDHLRVVCISDTHEKLDKILSKIPSGDVLIHCGDFCNFADARSFKIFNEQLGTLPHKFKFVIPGNHEQDPSDELTDERLVPKRFDLLSNCTVLYDSGVTVSGVKFFGSSWHVYSGYGITKAREKALSHHWEKIPTDTDILLTHTPPYGHGDVAYGKSRGCSELLKAVQKRINPKYHVFGHIHEGYGVTSDANTVFINASLCNHDLDIVNKPIVFDYPIPGGLKKGPADNLVGTFQQKLFYDCTVMGPGDHEIHPLTHEPHKLWEDVYAKDRQHQTIESLVDPSMPPKPGYIRFVCISDTHEKMADALPRIPPGDVLIHCGDFTNYGDEEAIKRFNDEMGTLPHKHKIVIAGNHELGFEDGEDMSFRKRVDRGTPEGYRLLTNCTYLSDSSVTIYGIKIYGSSWHPFEGFSFYRPRGQPMLDKWVNIPSDTDILLTHVPPLGYCDRYDGLPRGCAELLNVVEKRVKPKYHVFGHIHEGHGIATNGETTFINAVFVNPRGIGSFDPVVFDYLLPEGVSKER